MKARWVCKDRGCRQWGTGGPEGWTRHWRLEHSEDGKNGDGSTVSFGFVGGLQHTKKWSGEPGRPVWCEVDGTP